MAALDIDLLEDAQARREFLSAVLTLLVWGPYMFMSKRVKNTFVRG
jgi:hypothetical protein